MTPFEIISVVLALSTLAFAVIGWFLNSLINQHRELNKAKAETTDTKFDGLIQRLDDLVTQIGHLFRDQDVVTESMDSLSGRVGRVEKRIGEHFTRCNEREKALIDIKTRQDEGLKKLNKMSVGGHRVYDEPLDRIDREN